MREYHDRTKHSVASLHANPHFLDWDNQPLPFKIYTDLAPIALPRDFAPSAVAALDAIAAPVTGVPNRTLPDLRGLARLLYLSAGIVRTKTYPGGQMMRFRAAACTGALYHIDLYLVCGDLPDCAAGVYHFSPHDFALRRLRGGDYRGALVEATAAEPAVAAAPAVLVCASTFWRNAWKYQARAYRHCFWDTGTILANLLAVAAADGVPARVVLGFVDTAVNALLGLDPAREAALALIALGARPELCPGAAPPQPPLMLATQPLSAHEVDYSLIRAAQAASSLATVADVRTWRAATPTDVRPPAQKPQPLGQLPARSIDDVITHRGSARRFARAAISRDQLSIALRAAMHSVPGDWIGGDSGCAALTEAYLIVNAVDGVAAGTYAYDAERDILEALRAGAFRREAGFLDLGQELAADAAVNVYLLSSLDRVLGRLGDRGYRAAQLEAAIVGGRLYLAAYALGLGATGLTFLDDDVTQFFSPHAAGKSVMFLVAAGVPGRRVPG